MLHASPLSFSFKFPAAYVMVVDKLHNFLHVLNSFQRAKMEIARYLEPGSVMRLSLDDKSRVPLGITAANKQSAIVMHMEHCVRLPDHDFVVAERRLFLLFSYYRYDYTHHSPPISFSIQLVI